MSDQSLALAWQPFFMSLAGASATLAGLVFIAMTLHPQASLAFPLMRTRAFVGASGYLLGLTWSLIMLMPVGTAPLASLLLIAAGVVGGTCIVYQQVRVRAQGISRMRLAIGDPLLLAPIVAGVLGLLQPTSPLPFMLVGAATSLGFFVLFSQSWTLVLHSILLADVPSKGTNDAMDVRGELAETVARGPSSCSTHAVAPAGVADERPYAKHSNAACAR